MIAFYTHKFQYDNRETISEREYIGEKDTDRRNLIEYLHQVRLVYTNGENYALKHQLIRRNIVPMQSSCIHVTQLIFRDTS